MELIINNNTQQMVQSTVEIAQESSSGFIEANTEVVTLQHLKNDCVIPVFSKDNESTISHFQFIDKAHEVVKSLFPDMDVEPPKIRVSHTIKGRVPTAVGKPAKELLDHEKTIYYERCAFLIEIPTVSHIVNGNELNLSVGGVRSYSQENLYSKKSLEKFKVFIGFKNRVCTNLCVSSDGIIDDLRVSSIGDLKDHMFGLIGNYGIQPHLKGMGQLSDFSITEREFAQLIGRLRMYNHSPKEQLVGLPMLLLTDGQINSVVKNYYSDPHFARKENGDISLWKLYNLLTGANRSSYIDTFLCRSANAYGFVQTLGKSIQNNSPSWYL